MKTNVDKKPETMSANKLQELLRNGEVTVGIPKIKQKRQLEPKPAPTNSAEYQAQSKKKGDPEHQMQVRCVNFFRAKFPKYEKLFFAVPNGAKLPYIKNKKGKRYSPEAIKLLEEGMLPGMTDCVLAVPRGEWHGMFLELKILPNQPSPEQLAVMEELTKQGYYCQVIFTDEQFQSVVKNYLAL